MMRINLLPEEERGRRIRKGPPGLKLPSLKIPIVPQMIWMVVVVGAVVIVFLGFYISRRMAIGNFNKETTRMENKLAKLKREADLVRNLEAREKEMKNKLDIIKKLNLGRFLRVKMLDNLCSIVPDYMWITSFEEVSSTVKITGMTFSNLTVAKLIQDLAESEYFVNPELVSLRKKTIAGQDVMEFSLTTGMRKESPAVKEHKRPRRGSG